MWRCRHVQQVCKVRLAAQVRLLRQTVQAAAVVLPQLAQMRLQQLAALVALVMM
jgi:hypothetical protein